MALAMPRLGEMGTLPHSIRLWLAPVEPFLGPESRGLMAHKHLIMRRLYILRLWNGYIPAHDMSKKVSPCSLFVTKMAMTALQEVPYLLHMLYNFLNNKVLYPQKDSAICSLKMNRQRLQIAVKPQNNKYFLPKRR